MNTFTSWVDKRIEIFAKMLIKIENVELFKFRFIAVSYLYERVGVKNKKFDEKETLLIEMGCKLKFN